MAITDKAKQYHEKMFPNYKSSFLRTDPEFIERFDNFAFDEVVNHDGLDDKTRWMAIMSSLLGGNCIDEFKALIKASLNFSLGADELKEIVYQSVAYLGIGRVYPFLKAVNETFASIGISLPLSNKATTTTDNRLEKGIEAQVSIFGESMRDFYKSGDADTEHINYWLTDNCFGDYYTRTGLNYSQRELCTFCFLLSLGGCEEQLKAHIKANFKVGNDKELLIKVVSQVVPYIGYPRCLNAIKAIKTAYNDLKNQALL